MYPKLRQFIRKEYGFDKLSITTVVDHDGVDVRGITLRLTKKKPKFLAYIYSNFYLWDCRKLEAIEIPDEVVFELAEATEIFKHSWYAFQTAGL